MDGCDLFEFVKQREFLSEYDAAKITQQIIVGIRFLHSLEIVHRDLKPENIMVVMDQQKVATSIKVIDFGFSTYLSHLERLPPEERIVGTPNYIAPEVLKEDHLGFQIDNFAIGVTLFFMYLSFHAGWLVNCHLTTTIWPTFWRTLCMEFTNSLIGMRCLSNAWTSLLDCWRIIHKRGLA